jgi:hypothetical protein
MQERGRTTAGRHAPVVDVEPVPPVVEDEPVVDVELEPLEALTGTTGSLLAKICWTSLSIWILDEEITALTAAS